MRSFRTHTGIVAPFDRSDVDTDQIVPKQFLKRIERAGFGAVLFNDWRFRPDGTPVLQPAGFQRTNNLESPDEFHPCSADPSSFHTGG